MSAQLERIQQLLPKLTKGQLFWLDKVIQNYAHRYSSRLLATTFFSESMLQDFGDALRTHHAFSQEPLSKDKFEYALEQTCMLNGVPAGLAKKGNPGHDITINKVAVSLKTQANVGIKRSHIWISKFHELGKGEWSDKPEQLDGLRKQFLAHLTHYERIFTLRCLERGPDWEYELVEIPKVILALAETGTLEMMTGSKQMPKPGYCYVDLKGQRIFSLYFDGGGERKLQVKDLAVSVCQVHAQWKFHSPKLTPEGKTEPAKSDA